jgi:hydrogenase-4 component F
MLLAANPQALAPGPLMVSMGLVSLLFAAFMLYRRQDIKRMFAYSSIEHMGIVTFAFGMGGALANFAGLLHMTMHSLTKSAIFFAVGHIAQVKGTQKLADIRGLTVSHPALGWGLVIGVVAIAGLLHMTMHSLTKSAIFFAVGHIAQVKGTQKIVDIRGLTESHPVLGWGLVLGVVAIAGLPPLGIFMSEFLIVSSTFAREPLLAIPVVFGLLVAFGALMLRVGELAFGEPVGSTAPVEASYVPLFAHLGLVAVAGIYLPAPLVEWFQSVARLLG